jgi:uncharacterized membrane protein YeaQ/YmgE (transglycosylase-associated protein family)
MEFRAAVVLLLVSGAALGLGMRKVMGRRVRIGWAEAVVSGVAGSALGALIVSVVRGGYVREYWVGTLAAAVVGTVLVMSLVGYLARQPRPTTAELLESGESRTVEFKSTARCNLHTGQRDDRIEMVVSKTVAAFANSGGGDLLIGVDDDGDALGLEHDLKFMKAPDLDRYELWLRDHLTRTLGTSAASEAEVTFPRIGSNTVCHVRIPAAARPVFVTPGKGQPVQLWVRVGNSTRQLGVDEALVYAADRWGTRRLRAKR